MSYPDDTIHSGTYSPFEQSGPPEYFFNDVYCPSSYVWHEEGKLEVYDAIWGNSVIGTEPRDEVFIRFLSNPLVRRSMGIEQLTLDPRYATIPNTGHFSRFEHIWGSVVFARRMFEKSPELQTLDEREKLVLELRTFVSDLGHTAFSHLGDWITQGFGGPENEHDKELPMLMEASGANDILHEFDINPEEVIFPQKNDWVEAESPDLCIDRVDYGVREAARWMGRMSHLYYYAKPEAFTVQDGMLAMTSIESAEEFFRAYSILPTEHWQEPVHRTQLYLLESMVKRVIASQDLNSTWLYGAVHPRDALMAVDADFRASFMKSDQFMWTAEPLLRRLARAQREIFVMQRDSQLQGYFMSEDDDLRFKFPIPNQTYPWRFHQWRTLENQQISIIPVENEEDVEDFDKNPSSVDVFLPPFKSRSIDPLVLCSDGIARHLTEIKPKYEGLVQQREAVMKQAYVGRIYMNPTHAEIIRNGIKEANREFKNLMQKNNRMSPEELGKFLREAYPYERTEPLVKFQYVF